MEWVVGVVGWSGSACVSEPCGMCCVGDSVTRLAMFGWRC